MRGYKSIQCAVGLGLSLVLALASGTQAACTRSQVIDSFPHSYAGIGVELEMDPSGLPRIRKVHANGPAQASGVEPGDRVVSIDDEPTLGQSFGEIIMKLRGKPSSQLRLTLDRDNVQFLLIVRRQMMTRGAPGRAYTRAPPSADKPKDD